jgi:hypothetical protein
MPPTITDVTTAQEVVLRSLRDAEAPLPLTYFDDVLDRRLFTVALNRLARAGMVDVVNGHISMSRPRVVQDAAVVTVPIPDEPAEVTTVPVPLSVLERLTAALERVEQGAAGAPPAPPINGNGWTPNRQAEPTPPEPGTGDLVQCQRCDTWVVSRSRGRPRRFCSKACQRAAHRAAHKPTVKKPKPNPKTTRRRTRYQHCGTPLIAGLRGPVPRYCSDGCREAAAPTAPAYRTPARSVPPVQPHPTLDMWHPGMRRTRPVPKRASDPHSDRLAPVILAKLIAAGPAGASEALLGDGLTRLERAYLPRVLLLLRSRGQAVLVKGTRWVASACQEMTVQGERMER